MKKLSIIFFLALASCSKTEKSSAPAKPLTKEEAVARGRVVYSTVCTACHNVDPKLAGSLGPPVAGSSLELLEARIMNAAYPPGYKPKRATALMVAQPQVKDDIPAIYEYLNSLGN